MIILEDTTELGPIDESQIEALYAKLEALRMELDPDPLEMGPKRLNEKTAVCRGHLSECERVFAHLSQILHRYKRAHRQLAADYKLRLQEMLTNDVEVRGGRAQADREAIAATKLRSQVNRIEMLNGAVADLDSVMVVVKAKREDLRDIQRRLKDQQNMCREEISLGARWGSRKPESVSSEPSSRRGATGDEVEALMDEVLARTGASPQETPPEAPPEEGVLVGGGADSDYDAMLAVPVTSAVAVQAEFLDDFLADL